MKKLSLVVAAILLLFLSACSCGIEKKAVADLKATNDMIFPEYVRLVEKEYASDPAKIDNRKKLVQSANDIVSGLQKVVGK